MKYFIQYTVLTLAVLLLTVGTSAGQTDCPNTSSISVDQTSFNLGDDPFTFTVNYCASPNEFSGSGASNRPTLRINPILGPSSQVQFTTTQYSFANVNANASLPSNTLRGSGNLSIPLNSSQSHGVSFDDPQGPFDFEICLFKGQGANPSGGSVVCSGTVTVTPPTPTISVSPGNISISFEPRPDDPDANSVVNGKITKTFSQTVTVNWDNFVVGTDVIDITLNTSVPSGWVIDANDQSLNTVSQATFFGLTPTNFYRIEPTTSSGTTTVTFRVTVPLFEAPNGGGNTFTANYNIVTVN